jgi:hypothetical protein
MLLSLLLICSKHFIAILIIQYNNIEMVGISKFQSSWCFESEDRQIQCDIVGIIKTQANGISGKLKESVFSKTAGHHISEIVYDCS